MTDVNVPLYAPSNGAPGHGIQRRQRVRPQPAAVKPATVTVVIACFNYGRYLDQAVMSALHQEGVRADVVIVEDASTDDSRVVARRLASQDHRITLVVHDINRGAVASFNDGVLLATGEFLVRLDADDLLTPGSLRRSVAVLQAIPSVGLVYGRPCHFAGDERPPARGRPTAWSLWPGIEWLRDRCRSGVNVITSPEVVMRRSLVQAVGPMASLAHSHDMEYWMRFAAFGDVAYIHGVDQAWHREHGESLSSRNVDERVDLSERRQAFDTLFAGRAGFLPAVRELRAVARRALVDEAVETARHERDCGRDDSILFRYCLELARELDPAVLSLPLWAPLGHPVRPSRFPEQFHLGSLVRRMRGRSRSEWRWRRWRNTGVY